MNKYVHRVKVINYRYHRVVLRIHFTYFKMDSSFKTAQTLDEFSLQGSFKTPGQLCQSVSVLRLVHRCFIISSNAIPNLGLLQGQVAAQFSTPKFSYQFS